jgi:nitroreductase
VVFTVRTEMGAADIQAFIRRTAEIRKISEETLAGYRDMMLGSVVTGPLRAQIPEWATRQAYIALGNLMTSAALLGVDACPMEGFSPADFDSILDLKKDGYQVAVCCALGYRAANDRYAGLAKVRLPETSLIARR